jgi:biotin transport system substrate-specific component
MSPNGNAKSLTLTSNLPNILSSRLFWILTFSVITFISAQVEVPVQPVPFTLQTIVVLLAGAFLGPVNGAVSQLLYLAAGALGLPVFAGFSFGIPVLFGPTGGYLAAFPLVAFLVGHLVRKNSSLISVSLSMLLGTVLILLSGAFYLSLFVNGDLQHAFYVGAVIFAIWGLVKTAVAIGIYYSVKKKFTSFL